MAQQLQHQYSTLIPPPFLSAVTPSSITNRMQLPELPPEVWFRISTFLDPPSLSSLSQVNQCLHALATDQSHFRRFIPTEKKCRTHPAQLYRRQQALYHPPTNCLSIQQTSDYKMFCTIQDNLLLLDRDHNDASTLIAFPSRATFDLHDVIGECHRRVFSYSPFYSLDDNLRQVCAVLPEGHIAFLAGLSPKRLSVLDVVTGNTLKWHVDQKRAVAHRKIVIRSSVAPAGNNAQWVVFYEADNTVALFDWRAGTYVKRITDIPNTAKVVMGECHDFDGMSVVGILSEETLGSKKDIHCKDFDDDIITFKIDEAKHVEVVLRSVDKKTYVLLTSTDPERSTETEFLAFRKDTDNVTWWTGKLDMWISPSFGLRTWPELRENGRVIAASSGVTLMKATDGDQRPKQLWVVLNNDGTTQVTDMPQPVAAKEPKDRTQPIWLRRSYNGGFALLVGMGYERSARADVIDLVKLENDGNGTRETCLKRWYSRTLTDWSVVADHFVVAKRARGGTLCVYHFDEFCNCAEGVYKCPGLIPETYKVKTRESHACKRRRTSERLNS